MYNCNGELLHLTEYVQIFTKNMIQNDQSHRVHGSTEWEPPHISVHIVFSHITEEGGATSIHKDLYKSHTVLGDMCRMGKIQIYLSDVFAHHILSVTIGWP